MGTPDFAVPSLQALLSEGYSVVAVVTQPDKPKGRSGALCFSPVKETALAAGLPVLQPVKVRDPLFLEELAALAPDLIVVAAFGQIIPKTILELPRFGCVNLHGSLLPRYRGAAPVQYAVLDGEKESGVTLMQMGEGLDTGDMIARITVELAPDETGGSLFDKLSQAGAKLLIDTLPSIMDGTVVRTPQPEQSPTPYASMLTKEMGRLDFERTAVELERQIRGLNPWPCAYTFCRKKLMKVWAARLPGKDEGVAPEKGCPCGTVLKADKDGIFVACRDSILILTQVQIEGKKRMDAAAFLRGCPLQAKELLGETDA